MRPRVAQDVSLAPTAAPSFAAGPTRPARLQAAGRARATEPTYWISVSLAFYTANSVIWEGARRVIRPAAHANRSAWRLIARASRGGIVPWFVSSPLGCGLRFCEACEPSGKGPLRGQDERSGDPRADRRCDPHRSRAQGAARRRSRGAVRRGDTGARTRSSGTAIASQLTSCFG